MKAPLLWKNDHDLGETRRMHELNIGLHPRKESMTAAKS
jgi:hypothetical protein